MLLVPRDEKESLSDILGELPDGFYQIAALRIARDAVGGRLRPQRSGRQPREAARLVACASTSNQVVHNLMPMKYDALGDFQALLREDMFAIHGFDEDMILGWHCDSNLAARLALYRGRVDTLIDKVFGYHCDHTRVAAANNKGRKTKMNDQDRYIWNVSTPYLPEQAENWGWPDVEIEEVRLDRETSYERYVAGLEKAHEARAQRRRADQRRMAPVRRPHLRRAAHAALRLRPGPDLSEELDPDAGRHASRVPRRASSRRGRAWASPGPSWCRSECADLPVDQPGIETGRFADL